VKLWQAIHRWWNELRIQALILFRLGKEELALYRRERTLTDKTIWVPKGREWARARILRKGQKRLVVSFIDHGGIGTRSRMSIRWRNPIALGQDKPVIDPRYSGNRDCYGRSIDFERMVADAFKVSCAAL